MGHVQGILVWFSHGGKPHLLPGEGNKNAIFFLTLLNECPLLISAPLPMGTGSCLRLHFSNPTSVTNVMYVFSTHHIPSATMARPSVRPSHTLVTHIPLLRIYPPRLSATNFTVPYMSNIAHYDNVPLGCMACFCCKNPLPPSTLCLTHLIVPFYIVCSPSLSYNLARRKPQLGLPFCYSWVNILEEGLTVMTCVSST